MRIYTRAVYCWQPDGTLTLEEADSYEYEGPVTQMKEAGDPPPAPDYVGAASETARSSRANQVTPFGNLTWTMGTPAQAARPSRGMIFDEQGNSTGVDQGTPYIPGTPDSSTITLAPDVQRAVSAGMKTSADLSGLESNQTGRVAAQYAQPFDLNSVQDISDKAYAAQTARLDPQWAQRASQEETTLRNQGLVPGGEAYNNAMGVFNQGRNDAYNTARLSADAMMPQTFQLASSAYNQPLNALNALRAGSQVQTPQFMSTPGANYLGASQAAGQYATGMYGNEVGNAASQNQASGQALSTSALMALMLLA